MNKCANCGGEIDSEWPGNKGPICQMCWEKECSYEWWETCGGLLLIEETE